jgi:N-methylhydantoinase A
VRIGADVGGTFTDIVLVDDEGRVTARKVPSTSDAFEVAVVAGATDVVGGSRAALAKVTDFRHGTTVATNAVLERSGPLTAVVTTEGFRDVLELGRLRTPALYDLNWQKPVPLAPRRYRYEVPERMSSSGVPIVEPDLGALEEPIRRAIDEGVTTIAVSLLNAYANAAHEEILSSWFDEYFPDVDVTIATRLVREIGEYERTSTAVCNAYLRPVVSGYLSELESSLRENGCTAPVFVMQSSGGMMPVSESGRFPAHLLESGPAAGVLAAAEVARRAELQRAISFDMGGTTAKASLVEDFAVAYASEFSVGSEVSAASQLLKGGGYTVHLPVVDLAEVGAGGGSIARVDAGGGLNVGPRSAGAFPGPACYSRGGLLPTVTDANLILGYVFSEGLRAAGVDISVDLACEAMWDRVARPLGITVEEAALAVHDVANRQMARVLRAVTTERGKELAEHALIAFGGSGPLHAATMAETVGIGTVLVPPLAGVHSAFGLLTAPFELTTSQTLNSLLTPENSELLRSETFKASEVARARFVESGAPGHSTTVRQVLDVRYFGQASELPLDVVNDFVPDAVQALVTQFHELHSANYGHVLDAPIEVVRLRTTVTGASEEEMEFHVLAPKGDCRPRHAIFPDSDGRTPVVSRGELVKAESGPCLVDDTDTTTVVPPGWTVQLDSRGNLRLERQQ